MVKRKTFLFIIIGILLLVVIYFCFQFSFGQNAIPPNSITGAITSIDGKNYCSVLVNETNRDDKNIKSGDVVTVDFQSLDKEEESKLKVGNTVQFSYWLSEDNTHLEGANLSVLKKSEEPDENLQVILDNHFTADEAEQITAVYRCISAKESNKGAYDIDSMCRQLKAKNRERLELFGSTGYQLETDNGVIVNLYGEPAYTVMMTVDEKTVMWDVSDNTFFYDTAKV